MDDQESISAGIFDKEERALLDALYSRSKEREKTQQGRPEKLTYLVDTVGSNHELEAETEDDEAGHTFKLGRPFSGSIIRILRDSGEQEDVKIGWRELNRTLTDYSERELLQILHFELTNSESDNNRAYRVYQRFNKIRQERERRAITAGTFSVDDLMKKYQLPYPVEVE